MLAEIIKCEQRLSKMSMEKALALLRSLPLLQMFLRLTCKSNFLRFFAVLLSSGIKSS